MAVAVERSSRSGNDWTDTAGWIDRGCDVCCRTDDGLSFATETYTGLSTDALMANDPDIVRDSDGTVRIIYNHGTDAGGWIYSASHPGDLPW